MYIGIENVEEQGFKGVELAEFFRTVNNQTRIMFRSLEQIW